MSNDAIDTDQLAHAATEMAQTAISTQVQGIKNRVSNVEDIAKNLGVKQSYIDNLYANFKELVTIFLTSMGIKTTDLPFLATAEPKAPSSSATVATSTDITNTAAQAAATANAMPLEGTPVTSVSPPPATPVAPKNSRSVG